jgi:hypothetical protein
MAEGVAMMLRCAAVPGAELALVIDRSMALARRSQPLPAAASFLC